MSQGQSPDNRPNASNKQQTFEKLSEGEFGRFKRCLRKAATDLPAEAGGKNGHLKTATVDLLRNAVEVAWNDLAKGFPLFEETKGTVNWMRYLAGLRGLLRDYRQSHTLTAILPLLGIQELGEKTSAYSQEWLVLLHLFEKVFRAVDRYLDARIHAAAITSAYEVESEKLETLFASLKTWEDEEEFEQFLKDLKDLLDTTITVIIEGPVQLYLMISQRGFLLIFRSLMIRRIGDPDLLDKDLDSLMAAHDEVYKRVEESEAIKIVQEILRQTLREYFSDWTKEAQELRRLFPTKELRESFLRRFESGAIFGQQEEEED